MQSRHPEPKSENAAHDDQESSGIDEGWNQEGARVLDGYFGDEDREKENGRPGQGDIRPVGGEECPDAADQGHDHSPKNKSPRVRDEKLRNHAGKLMGAGAEGARGSETLFRCSEFFLQDGEKLFIFRPRKPTLGEHVEDGV